MKLTIIYDNDLYKKDIDLKSGWGFSCLVETNKTKILFDTGAKGKILLGNMQKLGINPKKIKKIVISHEHWDHYGGLTALADIIDKADLYRLAKQSPNKNIHLISVEESMEIIEGVYSTGRIKGSVDEQSLILKGSKGWYVLVGCSHPGVGNILNAAKKYGNIVGLIGGFHGFNNFNVVKDLDIICPCHCTAHKNELKKAFPDKISECGVGKIIDLD